ncbi:hypothetical protein [Pontibacter pamirensis]|uniref:hypothetical protein n=1 Tax=Pontibacter pamirensis TaxID=2562824 RepID=UPI001389D639|nr:hypothetical protein [Pontibacter pamirensis]
MMQLTRLSFLLVLLCSCATQRGAEKFFDRNPDKLAEYVEENTEFRKNYGEAYAARHFPAKVSPQLVPPAIERERTIVPGRLVPWPMPESELAVSQPARTLSCPECKPIYTTDTVYQEDTDRLDALLEELNSEFVAHSQTRQRLTTTEAERDFWQEKNRKKFWTLIAMVFFAVLYMIFRLLASRVRET